MNKIKKIKSSLITDIKKKDLASVVSGGVFKNPKPVRLIKHLVGVGSDKKNALILDFFAGSGATGQAVLDLNREDGGKRTFILCTNNENGIAVNLSPEEKIAWVCENFEHTEKTMKRENIDNLQ